MRRSIAKERVELRTTAQTKHYLELAAFVGGYASLTSFMKEAAELQAKKIFDELSGDVLTDRDRDILLEKLKESPELNDALKEAYQRICATYRIDKCGKEYQIVDGSLFKK